MSRNIAMTTRVCCTVNVFPIVGQEAMISYLATCCDLRQMAVFYLCSIFASHFVFSHCLV